MYTDLGARPRRALASLLVLIAGLAVVMTTIAAPTPIDAAEPAPIKLFMASDSVAQGALEEIDAGLPDHRLDYMAFPGLRLPVVTGQLDALRPRIGETVIVSLTNNHFFSPGSYAAELDAMMTKLRSFGVSDVIWVNAHLWHPAMRSINADIDAAARRWPEITVADWASTMRPHHLYGDGVHLRPAGQQAMADLVNAHVRTIDPTDRSPIGSLDHVTSTGSTLVASGWAFDRDVTQPIAVHVYVDGRFVVSVKADLPRPDVAAAHDVGVNHGFRAVVERPSIDGEHRVCTYAINVGDRRPNPILGCRTITIMSSPFGAVDVIRPSPNQLTLSGWAYDPDGSGPVGIHVYVDDVHTGVLSTGRERRDVAVARGIAAHTGFSGQVDGPRLDGDHRICVYAINAGAGANAPLGCRTMFIDVGIPGPWITKE